MSSPLPCGAPSRMSKSTTSPSCFKPASSASVPPICPAPTNAILLRAILEIPWSCRFPVREFALALRLHGLRHGTTPGVLTLFRQQYQVRPSQIRQFSRQMRPREIRLRLHLDEARCRAAEIERAGDADIESIRRIVGGADQIRFVLVERVDERHETAGFVALFLRHARDAIEDQRVEVRGDRDVVGGAQRLLAE